MQIRRFVASLTSLGLLVGGFFFVAPAAASNADPDVIPGAWIVTLKDSASPTKVAKDHGRRHGARVSHVYRHATKGYAARMSSAAANRIASDSRVARVEADRVMRAFGKPTRTASTTSTGTQSLPTGVKRVNGELSTAAKIDGVDERVNVDVAIIDSGIIASHSDLNVVGGYNCQNGSSWEDGNGHGTHVAGTVAALDNGTGVVGVAPGARLWAVRVLDNNGSGSWSSVKCGVDWVTGFNHSTYGKIEVANMSLGGSSSDDPTNCSSSSLHQAICNSVNAGVTYAVAAGNSAADAANYVPAKYDQVITVSALADFDGVTGGLGSPTCRTDEDDTFANFSNYGSPVDIIAPGVCVNSTWKDGGYNTISGTSMAAPHVAGAAALFKAANTGADPATVKAELQAKASTSWIHNSQDKDGVKEVLLDVGAFDTANFVTSSSDATAPTAAIANPVNGSTVGGTVTVQISASDSGSGVKTVEWAVDTGSFAAATLNSSTGYYEASWNTANYTNAGHTVTARVVDSANNVTTTSVSVTVSNSTSSPSTTTANDYISVNQFGGKTNDNHADLTVSVKAGTTGLSGSRVSVVVKRSDGSTFDTVSGTTDSSGNFTFGYRGLPSGTYTATVTDVIPPTGYAWDGSGDSKSWTKK